MVIHISSIIPGSCVRCACNMLHTHNNVVSNIFKLIGRHALGLVDEGRAMQIRTGAYDACVFETSLAFAFEFDDVHR